MKELDTFENCSLTDKIKQFVGASIIFSLFIICSMLGMFETFGPGFIVCILILDYYELWRYPLMFFDIR